MLKYTNVLLKNFFQYKQVSKIMTKLQKLFKAIYCVIKQPSLLNKVLEDAALNKEEVLKKYTFYEGLPSMDICDLIPNLQGEVNPYSFLDGTSTPMDLLLLKSWRQE